MSRTVTLPPAESWTPGSLKHGGWWHTADEGRIVCDLCPRACSLKEGDRGFCFVRQNMGGEMVLTTYGRSTGFCIDPIEKKPLAHFYPGTSVLSFGTAGCNLGCKFCQNWSISKSREIELLSEAARPEDIAEAALQLGCRSVAFTYNDPVIWAEYAIDTARACRERGIKTVAVTAGYITPEARGPFYEVMDAANVDLKGFTEFFYQHLTLSHLEPVLETLRWLKHETSVWFEITNLIIPRANDSPEETQKMCDWILENLGDEVPLHFTAFHPDFRLRDRPPTPPETLHRAHEIAVQTGLKYVYTGNIFDPQRQSTYCPGCGKRIIERDWHEVGEYHLDGNRCSYCGTQIAGHFESQPGEWGRRRMPVDVSSMIRRFARRRPSPAPAPPRVRRDDPTAKLSIPNATANPLNLEGLSPVQQQAIFEAASACVAASVAGKNISSPPMQLAGLAKCTVGGVFVSLKRSGRLRACCGAFGSALPLGATLATAAARSAKEDPRFPPIVAEEIEELDAEVWLLRDPVRVEASGEARADAVVVGRHGVQIAIGRNRGLLLPCVAVERGWDSRTFLAQVCRKAGLAPDAWTALHATVSIFEGVSIRGRIELPSSEAAGSRGTLPVLDADPSMVAESSYGTVSRPCHAPDETLLDVGETSGLDLRRGRETRAEHSPAACSDGHCASAGPDIRPAAVAGTFYPRDPRDMDRMIDGFLLSRCEPEPWSALLVPHAGWVYSGELAVRGFQRVAIPKTAIFFAPKHTRPGARWAVAPHDGWAVPGRTVPGDAALARELTAAVPGLELDAQAHRTEHAIEVQLPFLSRLASETRVVGIVMAQGELEELKQLAAHLADILAHRDERPLLVVSSDLNHFAAEPENRWLDHLAIDALGKLDPDALYETVHQNRISMCGVYAAVAVLETLRLLGQLSRAELVGYTNSAATSSDTSRVVGYASMVFG